MTARALLAALVALLAGCGPSPAPAARGDPPVVIATLYPLYEFARQVAGDRAEVTALVPPGVEPHDWEPSAPDLVAVQRARLLVYNGAGLEPWLDRLLRDGLPAGAEGVNTTAGVTLLRGAAADTHRHRDPPGGSAAPDPHVWLDPVIAQAQVEAIREALARVDPAGAPLYAQRAGAFAERLRALDQAYEAGLAGCARREIVTSHAAFAYLARRYRLTQVAITGLAPGMEPSPADLARLARFARQRGVTHVFFETLVSPRLADTLAREVGAATLVLNPLEGLTREEQAAGRGYLAVMEDNLRHLRIALGCR